MVVVLCTGNIAMLRDALVNGPTWYQDYTLAGMQYGASQLFKAVNEYVQQHPGVELMVSPNWTNGANAVASFFLPRGSTVRLGSVEGHLYQHLPLNDNMVFVVIPNEMEKVLSSGKFKDVQVDEVLNYPNGEPGFYFVRLKYVDNIDEILSAEQEVRRSLQEATVMIDGEAVQVRYSMLDMGIIDLAFDGNPRTLIRTLEANPFVIELTFPEPRQFNGYSIVLGSADVRVTTQLYPAPGGQPVESVASFNGSVNDPELRVDFEQTVTAQVVRFEILEPYAGEPANVHVWEITLR